MDECAPVSYILRNLRHKEKKALGNGTFSPSQHFIIKAKFFSSKWVCVYQKDRASCHRPGNRREQIQVGLGWCSAVCLPSSLISLLLQPWPIFISQRVVLASVPGSPDSGILNCSRRVCVCVHKSVCGHGSWMFMCVCLMLWGVNNGLSIKVVSTGAAELSIT